jgi:hypothetical protein
MILAQLTPQVVEQNPSPDDSVGYADATTAYGGQQVSGVFRRAHTVMVLAEGGDSPAGANIAF